MSSTTPLATKEKFAESIGIPVSVLQGQIQKGYWPLVQVGRRTFINVQAVADHASKSGSTFAFKK